MSWQVIARKELKDSIRSRSLIVLSVLFVLLSLFITGLYAAVPFLGATGSEELTVQSLISFFGTAVMFVPIIAVLLGYKAIVGERQSGSLALTLSLPHTRDDVVLGKFLGRSVVLAIPILLAFLAGLVVVIALFDAYSVIDYLVFVFAVLLIGVAYLSLAIGFSGSTTSSVLSGVGVFVLYVLFRFLWGPGLFVTQSAVNRVQTGEWSILFEFDWWMYPIAMINPHYAYQMVLYGFVYGDAAQPRYMGAWYVNGWTGLAVLAAWTVVPLAVGGWLFRRSDL
ncbi:ABC transporter permease subunit [Natronoarchaeum sp. GCM10025321]|uniref:ABC transporter permease subunit n=1 Tax=Natronoarchaeum sp. GCM10025321 TaxID=3252684 RepID=UPI003616201A